MEQGFYQVPREESTSYSLLSGTHTVSNQLSSFIKEVGKTKVSDFDSIFAIKGDLAAEGEIVVAKRENLDRSRHRVPQTSRTEPARPENLVASQASRSPPTIYDYNASAEAPVRGELLNLF